MRKLATIRRIAEIRPIENADAIEHVRVDGWWVVGKKGHFIPYMGRRRFPCTE